MKRAAWILSFIAVTGCISVYAQGFKNVSDTLTGYEETPSISTSARGTFVARISADESSIAWVLSYSALEGNVTQAHIHFGQTGVAGGISMFFCTNLGNGPAGTPLCPAGPATLSGIIRAGDVIGPAAQGISPGELAELIAAIRAGKAYANVHSTLAPTGEIRGQIDPGAGH
jgi:hypothetical protein